MLNRTRLVRLEKIAQARPVGREGEPRASSRWLAVLGLLCRFYRDRGLNAGELPACRDLLGRYVDAGLRGAYVEDYCLGRLVIFSGWYHARDDAGPPPGHGLFPLARSLRIDRWHAPEPERHLWPDDRRGALPEAGDDQ